MSSAIIGLGTMIATKAETNIIEGEVISVVWGIDDTPNTCEISIPTKRIQEFRQNNAGREVFVKIRKNFTSTVIFHGWITGRAFEFEPNTENVVIICQGPRWRLKNDFIKGQFIKNADDEFRVLSGLKAVFNDTTISDEGFNAAIESDPITKVKPFSLIPGNDEETAIDFSLNDMLFYLYTIGKSSHGDDIIGDILTLDEAGIGDVGVFGANDVNVDGMNITSALNLAIKRVSLRWWLRPVSETQSEVRAMQDGPAAIDDNNVPKKDLFLALVSPGVSPDNAVTLKTISNSINNIESGRLNEDFSDLFNDVIGYGDRKVYQSEFQHLPGWDTDEEVILLQNDIATVRKELKESSSSDWEKFEGIGRKWILDENGSLTTIPFDFNPVFGSDEYAQTNRVFEGQRPDLLEFESPIVGIVSLDDEKKAEDVNIVLSDKQAGFNIQGDEMKSPFFVEKSNLIPIPIFASSAKLIAGIKEDKAIEKRATAAEDQEDGELTQPDNAEQIQRRLGLLLEDEYKTNSEDPTSEITVLDDLQVFVDKKLEENKNPRVSSSFSIPFITLNYEPGDIIQGIVGRDIKFTGQIIEIRFNFSEQNTTEIICEDLRLAESG